MERSSQAFIVIGMPRTGTSLTMGLLAAMGVYVGTQMRMGNNNPNYFENMAMSNWINGVKGVKAADVVAKLNRGEKWGMKHPNLATRWEELKEFIDNPHFVVTHRRDFQAQTKSHRATINRKQSPAVIKARHKDYYKTVDKISKGLPRIDVYFEDWFTEKKETQIKWLAKFAGLTITRSALGLIDPRLKHY